MTSHSLRPLSRDPRLGDTTGEHQKAIKTHALQDYTAPQIITALAELVATNLDISKVFIPSADPRLTLIALRLRWRLR